MRKIRIILNVIVIIFWLISLFDFILSDNKQNNYAFIISKSIFVIFILLFFNRKGMFDK